MYFMKKAIIIIPSRLAAKRLPNKPLLKIKGKPMIIHVLEKAKKTNLGEVYVATPDKKIKDVVEAFGGKAILTRSIHSTGSDRIFEAFSEHLKHKADFIINIQGDMPNFDPNSVIKVNKFMNSNDCDIGTLASNLRNNQELKKVNIVKVEVEGKLSDDSFLKTKDFFREKKINNYENIFHHIGIYVFKSSSLKKFVSLKRSNKEIERNLEQMRALENNMLIKVAYTKSKPLSVDTEQDLVQIQRDINL